MPLAKALNGGDYALAGILLAQAQFPALPDRGVAKRMQKAAAMFRSGAPESAVLEHFLPGEEVAKLNPNYRGPGPGGGQFTTADTDGASSRDATKRGYATKLSADEIRRRAKESQVPGWLYPKDVKPGNEKECVSLVQAVIPKIPHSSQWTAGDPVTPESAKREWPPWQSSLQCAPCQRGMEECR